MGTMYLDNVLSQCDQFSLVASADKQNRNYGTKCSSQQPSQSTRYWYWSLARYSGELYILKFKKKCHGETILSLERGSLGQETFLEPSIDKQTHNYDTEGSNQQPSIRYWYWAVARWKGAM